jgi:hypothetical protein
VERQRGEKENEILIETERIEINKYWIGMM